MNHLSNNQKMLQTTKWKINKSNIKFYHYKKVFRSLFYTQKLLMLLNFTYFDLNVEFGQIALKTSSDTYLLMNMNCIGLKLIPCKFSIISLEISIFLVLYTFCQYLISIHTGKTIYHCLLQNFVRIPSCPSMVYKS